MNLKNNLYEKAFGNFLERHEYDEAESALFDMVRIAFSAGWRAAGGEKPCAEKVVELRPPVKCLQEDK